MTMAFLMHCFGILHLVDFGTVFTFLPSLTRRCLFPTNFPMATKTLGPEKMPVACLAMHCGSWGLRWFTTQVLFTLQRFTTATSPSATRVMLHIIHTIPLVTVVAIVIGVKPHRKRCTTVEMPIFQQQQDLARLRRTRKNNHVRMTHLQHFHLVVGKDRLQFSHLPYAARTLSNTCLAKQFQCQPCLRRTATTERQIANRGKRTRRLVCIGTHRHNRTRTTKFVVRVFYADAASFHNVSDQSFGWVIFLTFAARRGHADGGHIQVKVVTG